MASVIKKKNDNLVSIYHKQVSVNHEKKNSFIIQSPVSCKLASASAVVRAWAHWPGTEPRLSDPMTFQRLIKTVESWSLPSSTVPAFSVGTVFQGLKEGQGHQQFQLLHSLLFLQYVPICDKV